MSDQKKPTFDEQTLAKLLEAAYVLQEHNRERRKSGSERELKSNTERPVPKITAPSAEVKNQAALGTTPQDYQGVLNRVVETQQRIEAGHLSRYSSLMLIAEQALNLAHGSGAAIALLDGEYVHYEAVAGIAMMPNGAVIPVEDAMCAISVRTGEAFRCAEINPAILPDIEECRRSGVQAFIVVPIFLQEKVAGALELYYTTSRSFSEQDVHACQLLAGLVAEVPSRDGQPAFRNAAAATAAPQSPIAASHQDGRISNASNGARASSVSQTVLCQKCGHELLEHEQFCVECGARRAGSNEFQKPGDSELPHVEAIREFETPFEKPVSAPGVTIHDLSWAEALKDHIPELFAAAEIPSRADLDSPELESSHPESSSAKISITHEEPPETKSEDNSDAVEETPASQSLALSKPPVTADWSSASSAREFLEQLAGGQRRNAAVRLWNERRGDIYLALAVLLVACVIRWGIWSNPSVKATAAAPNSTATHQKSPDADLSVFDRLLIALGLAEAPEPAVDRGNPSAQVWIDLHTALYYCQGSDMYGKTATGKYATQRDAQLDSFEPAYRKVCE